MHPTPSSSLSPRQTARIALTALVLGGLATLTACAPPDESRTSLSDSLAQTTGVVTADPVTPVEPLEPSLIVEDPAGGTFELDAVPERIVCVTGICDDILVSLGLVPAGTTVPEFLALPEYLGADGTSVTVIPGGFGNEDIEVIASLDPDLVIGLAGAQENLAEGIEKFAPYWLAQVETVEQSVGYLRALGQLTGRTTEAAAVETELRQAQADAEATSKNYDLSDVPVLAMYNSSYGSGVFTVDTVVGDLLKNHFAYPWKVKDGDPATAYTFSQEEILEVNPAAVFIISYVYGADDLTWSEQVAADPVWKRIEAVRSDRAVEVDTTIWGSGRGPKALTLVLREALEITVG